MYLHSNMHMANVMIYVHILYIYIYISIISTCQDGISSCDLPENSGGWGFRPDDRLRLVDKGASCGASSSNAYQAPRGLKREAVDGINKHGNLWHQKVWRFLLDH